MNLSFSRVAANGGADAGCLPTQPQRNQLSFAQQRLWFLRQLGGASEAYHISSALRLIGSLDAVAVRRALDRIVQRHEALRTTFGWVDGVPVQRFADAEASRFELQEHDWRGRGDCREALERLAAEEPRRPFDFEVGPLIRGQLLRVADQEHALLVTMHHIVSDGWSMGVLVEEFTRLYDAFSQGRADPLPKLDVQYADCALWQRQWIEGELLQQQRQYWQRALSGAPALLELPWDFARPARQDYRGGLAHIELGEELTKKLKALTRRHNATLYMTLLGAFAALLGRLSGQQDVVIGTPSANRERSEIQGLIGFFVNTLAMRIDLSGSPSVSKLIERTKRQVVAALQHQDFPFEQVVEILQPPRSLSHSPIFQTMFQWQNIAHTEPSLPGLRIEPVRAASSGETAKFDLTLVLYEVQDRIVGWFEYATSLFEQATIERYGAYFRRLLEAMTRDEMQVMDHLEILDERERHHLLYECNETGAEYGLPAQVVQAGDRASNINELIEATVARCPDAVAAVCGDEQISYAALIASADQLADRLVAAGVKAEDRIGIYLPRSIAMLAAVLGVMRAGAA